MFFKKLFSVKIKTCVSQCPSSFCLKQMEIERLQQELAEEPKSCETLRRNLHTEIETNEGLQTSLQMVSKQVVNIFPKENTFIS